MSQQNQSDTNNSSKILEMKFDIGHWQSRKKLVFKNQEISLPAPDAFSYQEFPDIIVPTGSGLADFSQSLDELNVWEWKKYYSNSNIMDGVQWSLTIRTDSKELDSGGSNDFPENIYRFIQSINQLINMDYFFDGYRNAHS
jgi:hypothetical protein